MKSRAEILADPTPHGERRMNPPLQPSRNFSRRCPDGALRTTVFCMFLTGRCRTARGSSKLEP
jgi:hypothetical protein